MVLLMAHLALSIPAGGDSIPSNESRFRELQRLQFSRVNLGHFGTFWDAGVSALTTRKPLNHAAFLHFSASDPSSDERVQIPSGTLSSTRVFGGALSKFAVSASRTLGDLDR
jgi:hypothetical protein